MKIKRIIVTILLSISLTMSIFFIKQRQAEAVVPFAVYVAISALVHFAIGAYVYFNNKDTGNTELRKVGSKNETTGEVSFELVYDSGGNEISDILTGTTGANPVKIYPYNDVPSYVTSTPSHKLYSADITDVSQRQSIIDACINTSDPYIDICTLRTWQPIGNPLHYIVEGWLYSDSGLNFVDPMVTAKPPLNYNVAAGVIGGAYEGTIEGNQVTMYEFLEDVPQLPTCFDGIQNQDETGIDCGGVCLTNFGLDCTPPETCFDGIMNQDETGIDYGGVCGGEPVPPAVFTDANQDNIDDIAGVSSDGSVPVGVPGNATDSTYDTSLPGTVSEIGDTDWKTLIMNYLSTSPLVQLATGATINVSGADCSLNATVFGHNVVINFCDLQWMVDLLGTFVLAIFTLRSLFIALGVD